MLSVTSVQKFCIRAETLVLIKKKAQLMSYLHHVYTLLVFIFCSCKHLTSISQETDHMSSSDFFAHSAAALG